MTTEEPSPTMPEATKESWREWETAYTAIIIRSVNELRGHLDITVKQLAERLEFFGWPVGVATLNGILGGKKRTSVTAGEILVFARALNTTPVYLMLGLPGAERIPEGRVFWPGSSGVLGMGDWFGGTVGGPIFHPYPDDIEHREAARFVNRFSEQALGDMREYTHLLQVVQWQNALLTEIPRFEVGAVRRVLPAWAWSGEAIRDALWQLRRIREHHRTVKGFPLPQLRKGLEFLDGADDVYDMSFPIIDYNSGRELDSAREYLQKAMRTGEKAGPDHFTGEGTLSAEGVANIGSPTNSDQ